MKIFLLTHEQELSKKSNTGSIALQYSGGVVERVLWQRVRPDEKLTSLITSNLALLLYPTLPNPTVDHSYNNCTATIEDYENIIIIDSTWQESRKIYNKSPYLKNAPQAELNVPYQSKYQLRRNQVSGGLCTIECVIEVLKIKKRSELALTLESEFAKFNA